MRNAVTSAGHGLARRLGGLPPIVQLAMGVALVPVARMTWWTLHGTRVQFADYWLVLDGLVDQSGRLRPGDLLEAYNGHVMAGPKVLYFLNIEAFGGSNVSLGLLVVTIGLAQVGLLWSIVPRGADVRPAATASMVVAIAAFGFAPHGAWSFLRAMSGAAWLTANLLAIAAIVVRARGRSVAATVLAVLAALCYGTGLVAFPAVIVVGLAVHRRLTWDLLHPALAGLAFGLWYRLADAGSTSGGVANPLAGVGKASGSLTDPLEILRNATQIIGGPLSPTSASRAGWIGLAAAVLAGVVVVRSIRTDSPRAAPWLGVLALGWGSALLIGYSRAGFAALFPNHLAHSRYSSIAALAWLATLALAVQFLGDRPLLPAVVCTLAVGIALSGTGVVRATQDTYLSQQELANAQLIGVADGGTPWIGLGLPMPPLDERLRPMGHYPFDRAYDGDCGLLGTQIPTSRPVVLGGVTSVERSPSIPDAVAIHGWAYRQDRKVDCVLVTGADRVVVGVGTWGWSRLLLQGGAREDGFVGLAPRSTTGARLFVRFEGDETFVEVPVPPADGAGADPGG